jgi:diacylglycerol O-acyltransferase
MTPPALNHRLTTLDATFLYTEKPVQPMHVGGSMLYEGHLSLDVLVRALECRLHLLPRYRQKVVFPPFAAAHPTWEDDPAFDIRHHVTQVTLPAPGDDRALSEVGGAAFAGMLDRDHPLWKLIVVHGRADGNTAVIWKVHHAMIDGVSGVDLTMVLHDLKPDAAPPEPPATPWQPRPLPDPLTLLQNAVRDRVTEVAQSVTDDVFRLLRPTELETRIRQLAGVLGQPTEGVEIRAMCPVSMRRPDERGALGNLVSMIFAPLYVGVLAPVERLAAERAAMTRLKDQDQAGGLYEMTHLMDRMAPAVQAVAGQLNMPNTLLNTVSTNVPGPQIPLYLSGHRLVGWCPLIPLANEVGLVNAILTYDQRLTIGVTVDPKLVPDVWLYVECLKASFAELLQAADAAETAGAGSPAPAAATR